MQNCVNRAPAVASFAEEIPDKNAPVSAPRVNVTTTRCRGRAEVRLDEGL